MLQFINDLPEHVVGIHAIGEVTKEDYDKVLVPRLEDLAKRQGEINYLIVLETNVQNFALGTWFQDLKLALKHFTKWKKVAIVTDQHSIEWTASNIVNYLLPGHSKGFSLDKLDEAVKWIAE
ncbi:STAS/SEC14 domain-containing protein [Mucilaginibacter robiniae]|uniref:STAS/SEC14 domain-containing protein n=1 Tax=Mucilaginibacter robiniae TaxID=2728022 RepID=A0A7L5E6T7_9SPHI|nr:STAS/SEC14 domain-containing protein [Mucilaginibacter robiniae]QJD97484.1 STAS/SEC14 domain-containing protein [Mucilaginibacter robiniae]